MRMLVAAMVVLLASTAAPAAPTLREIRGSELLVQEYLDHLDVPAGQITPLVDDNLALAFPAYLFFVVSYPPASASNLPAPLKQVNVFAVDPQARVTLLNDPDQFVALFTTAFNPGQQIDRCKLVTRVTLLLLRAEYPSYQLDLPEEEIVITPEARRRKRAVGRLVAVKGGTGAVEVVLTLDRDCIPLRIVPTVTLQPAATTVVVAAPAPTVVVAAEKVVRTAVIQANLPADPVKYINDPVLVRTFPNTLLFVAPLAQPRRGDPRDVLDVMVVNPGGGQPVRLFSREGGFIRWFNASFGPARTDPRIREAVTVVWPLLIAARPTYTFGTPVAPVITTEGNLTTIVSKRPMTSPSGKQFTVTLRMTFNKNGKLVAWHYGIKPV